MFTLLKLLIDKINVIKIIIGVFIFFSWLLTIICSFLTIIILFFDLNLLLFFKLLIYKITNLIVLAWNSCSQRTSLLISNG